MRCEKKFRFKTKKLFLFEFYYNNELTCNSSTTKQQTKQSRTKGIANRGTNDIKIPIVFLFFRLSRIGISVDEWNEKQKNRKTYLILIVGMFFRNVQ